MIRNNNRNAIKDLLFITFLSTWLGFHLFIQTFVPYLLQSHGNNPSIPLIYILQIAFNLIVIQVPVGLILAFVFIKLKSKLVTVLYFVIFLVIALYQNAVSAVFFLPFIINESYQIYFPFGIARVSKLYFALPIITSFSLYLLSELLKKLTVIIRKGYKSIVSI